VFASEFCCAVWALRMAKNLHMQAASAGLVCLPLARIRR